VDKQELKRLFDRILCLTAVSIASLHSNGNQMAKSLEHQQKAEAQFHQTIKKAQQAKQTVSQYEADAAAERAKTAKLRALRLAKEAAEAKAEAEKKIVKKQRSVSKKTASLLAGEKA